MPISDARCFPFAPHLSLAETVNPVVGANRRSLSVAVGNADGRDGGGDVDGEGGQRRTRRESGAFSFGFRSL